jgi:hypothetical protein
MEVISVSLDVKQQPESTAVVAATASAMDSGTSTAQAVAATAAALPLTPQVGQVFSVKRLDGECLPAEVLETRLNEKGKKTEYFVHFENC